MLVRRVNRLFGRELLDEGTQVPGRNLVWSDLGDDRIFGVDTG